ncbi:hypothetical protein KVR01_002557 [Diaporthe batatas]|uniref:uncharacterized protein n=1 Tax=Diaporthe batatas TaxID=748121 RepID=UPI001D0559F0|nr:uncharacterized protein KVR01_002557 [Diaporthe batatas]KAG8166868.1 hypothetical protein KVR01_002557 [Diaporthe batatas]
MDPPSGSSFVPTSLILDDDDSGMEYKTVPPPASIERSRAIEILDQPHTVRFCGAMMNILHSKPAEFTFAQLVDGLPLAKVASVSRALRYEEPVRNHKELCPGAMDKVRALRDTFDPASLDLPVEVLRRYQNIPAGSRASKLPFIELIVVAVHRLAVLIHREGNLHKEKDPTFDQGRPFHRWSGKPYPTPFCLIHYSDPEQYPDGVADLAGYWAENWIFGGVVVFSRGESGTECNGVWLHSCKEYTTDSLWALTEDQVARLLGFLESNKPPDCPLPIKLERANRRRVDPDNCIPEYNIYRDRWERKMRYPDRDSWEMLVSGRPDVEVNYPLSEGEPDLF